MRFLKSDSRSAIHWAESVRFAYWALKIDRVKAILTMIGVVIGSAAIVLVVTIASTGKTYILSQIEGIGANISYATLDRSGASYGLDDELTPTDLANLRQQLPYVRAAAGTYDLPVDLHTQHKQLRARLVGVTQDFERIRNLRITSGRYFDGEDFRAHSKVCLVTDHLAATGFGGFSPVGSTVRLDEMSCTVIGTFKEGVPTFGQSEIQDETLLVPFPLIKDITGDNFFQVLYAQVASADEVPSLTRQLDRVLHTRHRTEARYSIQNLSSLLQTVSTVSFALTLLLLGIALITLIVAGTGIMNIMLVNVSQRTHEIGIRKAMGARTSEIRLQFLFEAFFISFSGAVVGILAALALISSATYLVESDVPLGISWTAVAVALVTSSSTGILFGYRPASTAADMNPVDALRIE